MNHEKLDCYRELITVAKELGTLMDGWPRGSGYLIDQIRRAISSAVLNLAEGNGKRGQPRERKRFFRISMGSIAEVAAALDLASAFSLIPARVQEENKAILRAAYNRIGKLS
jgi:four helix bundle protein